MNMSGEAPMPWKCGCEQPGCKATNGTSPPQPCGCSGNLCCDGSMCYRDEQGCTCCRSEDVCDTCIARIEAEEARSKCTWDGGEQEGPPHPCTQDAEYNVQITGERDDGELTCKAHLSDTVLFVLEFDYPDGPAKAVTVSRVESDS